MIKVYCDRCGIEIKSNALTEVVIPKEKGENHTIITERIIVCNACATEHDKIIDALTDIRFLMFEKFYNAKGASDERAD